MMAASGPKRTPAKMKMTEETETSTVGLRRMDSRSAMSARTLSAATAYGEPNPTRGPIHISCAVETQTPVTVDVVDLAGRTVVRQPLHRKVPGGFTLDMDLRIAGDVCPGVYFVRVRSGGGASGATRVVLVE